MCVCVSVCSQCMWVLAESRSLKDGITSICELPNMGSGIRTRVLMVEQQVFLVTVPFPQPLGKLKTAKRKEPDVFTITMHALGMIWLTCLDPSWAKLS